tara:strand:+ start:701 stop:853 length:153 start_codon:yes stop_codon:yes gene_type:complete
MKIEERTFPAGAGIHYTRWVLFDDDGKVLELAFAREQLIERQKEYEAYDG